MKRSAIGHVATALLREIGALIRSDRTDREKTIMVVENVQSTEWASLTFVGERHVLNLRIEGEATSVATVLATIERDLGDLEFSIPGHFIAEIRAEPMLSRSAAGLGAGCRSLRIEALVLRD